MLGARTLLGAKAIATRSKDANYFEQFGLSSGSATEALWCMLGYLVGLGDRHLENILIDTESGRRPAKLPAVLGSRKAQVIHASCPEFNSSRR